MNKILVTGCTSGIGAAITACLLKRNIKVVGIARNHQKMVLQNVNYFPYTVDCAKLSGLEEAFKVIRVEHDDIDALIGCCGYGHFAELEQFSFQQMQKILNVNFMSQALLIKTFLPHLKKRPGSKIIMLGSECALVGQKKGAMYSASKFALRGFMQSLRQECRHSNVAVTIINPGLVDTPFFEPLNFKPGLEEQNSIQPEQVAIMVDLVLQLKNNCVVEEINCQPMSKVIVKNVLV